jgi:hypothetical protein
VKPKTFEFQSERVDDIPQFLTISPDNFSLRRSEMMLLQPFFRGTVLAFVALLSIGLFGLLGYQNSQAAFAQRLVEQASEVELPAINADQVWYFRTTVYQRLNPTISDPSDPYHKSVSRLFSDTYIVEQWHRDTQWRSTARDSQSQEVIFDRVDDGDRKGIYEVMSGYAYLFPQSSLQTEREGMLSPAQSNQKGVEIVGTVTSTWNTSAWVIQKESKVPPLEAESNSAVPLFQGPYWKDLEPTSLSYIWVVDQESQRLISFEMLAITPSGPVVVSRLENTAPELLIEPNEWLTFPHADVPLRDSQQLPVPTLPSSISLQEAIAAVDFVLFLPDTTTWGLDIADVIYNPKEKPEQLWRREWRFDIQDTAARGLALEVMYFPKSPKSEQALVVIQGASEKLVPLMRETWPTWAESHPVQLDFDNYSSSGWVATGGVLDNAPAQVVVMLEVENTFFFIVGQGYSEAEVLKLVETLEPVR